MNLRRKWRSVLFLLPMISVPIFGQALFQVSGFVEDQSGAAMPGTSVSLRNSAEIRQVQADEQGAFSFDRVANGVYDLQVEHDGFKPETVRVTVNNRSPRRIELKLKIAN